MRSLVGKKVPLSLKTMEQLLISYVKLEESIRINCAEKIKFKNLIIELEADIELATSFPDTNTKQE